MNFHAELRLERMAHVDAPRPLRHLLAALLEALGVEQTRRADVVLAVGEALSNAVEHAYAGTDTGTVAMSARSADGSLVVEVADNGNYIDRDGGTPGRGFGMRIVRAVAQDVTVQRNAGTRVAMTFDLGIGHPA